MPGLGTSFGRGGATTAQQDLANADAILIMGSTMAENHPVGFQWVMEARERGATVIHVDPRFTRTSAMADIWVPLRAGTDILFLGGLIHYVLENDKWFHEYVEHYTNAPMLVREDFRDTEDLGGLFSGWDKDKQKYSPETWLYQGEEEKESRSAGVKAGHSEADGGHGKDRGGEAGKVLPVQVRSHIAGPPLRFPDSEEAFRALHAGNDRAPCRSPAKAFPESSRGVLQCVGAGEDRGHLLRCGMDPTFQGRADHPLGGNSATLLGNIGRPGGGILALRGHASIQGSTDIPTLYDILPGYLPMPFFEEDANDFKSYLKKHTANAGLWNNFPKYAISLLKAYYGENATKDNDWGFDYLPRVTGDHSHFGYWLDMADGKMDGLFIMGQNPAVGASNARLQRTRHVETEVAGGSRHGGDRERFVVV